MRMMTLLAISGALVSLPQTVFAHDRDRHEGHHDGHHEHDRTVREERREVRAVYPARWENHQGRAWHPQAPERVWVPGFWSWRGHQRVWVEGAYAMPPQVGAAWIAPQWAWDPHIGRWVWHEGHWSVL